MTLPLVTFGLPIYNCSDFGRGNGRMLLPSAIESLLAQTYPNFELLILDNQSTDSTPQICSEYARRDTRVRYVVDSRKRNIDEAMGHMASLANGKYLLPTNDDDLWHPACVEKLVGHMMSNPDLDMVYPNSTFIDIDSHVTNSWIAIPETWYSAGFSSFANLCDYIINRNPLPVVFGLFKTEVFRKMHPLTPFDGWGANMDNLLMIRFFSRGFKIDLVNELLFHYRDKARPLKGPNADRSKFPDDFPPFEEPILIWFYFVRHQLYFKHAIIRELDAPESMRLTPTQRLLLESITIETFIYHCGRLFDWIERDEIPRNDQTNISRASAIQKFTQSEIANYDWVTKALARSEYGFVNDNPQYVHRRFELACNYLHRFENVLRYALRLTARSCPAADDLLQLMTAEIARADNMLQSSSLSGRV